MSVYHQMGHDSKNLLFIEELSGYSGAILSPVNYTKQDMQKQIKDKDRFEDFEFIFDPQLYFPHSNRGELTTWNYYPSDVDTADMSSSLWWHKVSNEIVSVCEELKVESVCSPIFVPKIFSNSYYDFVSKNIGDYFYKQAIEVGLNPIQSLIVDSALLSDTKKIYEISSIISKTKMNKVYLIISTSTNPRNEIGDVEEIKGIMKLINLFEESGLEVIVGFCSSDLILWKAAGATSCATGKFFNLRRFSSSRFDEPSGGGGQLPYLFDDGLITYLRESDVLRVNREELLSQSNQSNIFTQRILENLDCNPPEPWLALSWRQYLLAFCELEKRLVEGLDIKRLLKDAEETWIKLEDKNVLLEERRNTGSWIRHWRRALIEFRLL